MCNESDIHGGSAEIDDSMASNDSTPKFMGKAANFLPKFASHSDNSDIMRAKELVLKAARLNTQVKIQ